MNNRHWEAPQYPSLPVTVVIPSWHEEAALSVLLEELDAAPNFPRDVIIALDEDPHSRSWLVERSYSSLRIRVVGSPRREGKTAILRLASGAVVTPIVATMDGDGQVPPEAVTHAISVWTSQGTPASIVHAERRSRPEGLRRRTESRLGNRLVSRLTGVESRDCGSSVVVGTTDVIRTLLDSMPNAHRYLPVMARLCGFQVIPTSYDARRRYEGKSKYSPLGRYCAFVRDIVFLVRAARRNNVE